MQATGMLFMSRTKPLMKMDCHGRPHLTLNVVNRIATHQTEAWRLTWTGASAMEFMAAHAQDLNPGQPLNVVAKNMRSHVCGTLPEIQAEVIEISIVETSHA